MNHHHHRQGLVPGEATRDDALTWIRDADAVLLTAGAGLSSAAGYDYGDTQRFAELFPALHTFGFRARYELIGAPLPATHLWGYWAVHTSDIRFNPEPNPLYQRLREVVGDRDHFVMTSNVDALFTRNGFDPEHVFTPQGDYGLYQCKTPCTRQVWDSRPVIERALTSYDPLTGGIDPEHVPLCPNCGGETYLNVNTGANYIADHFASTGNALNTWLVGHRDTDLLILEIGAGFNTPGVIRLPDEHLTRHLPRARLVRANPQAADVPSDVAARAASARLDATAFMTMALEQIASKAM